MKRSSFFKTTQQLQALNERENASSLIHTKAQVKLHEDVTQAIEFPWAPFSARKGNHFLYLCLAEDSLSCLPFPFKGKNLCRSQIT